MITQRPVTGSRRSSGIRNQFTIGTLQFTRVESVLKDLDLRPSRVEMDRHDVEPAGTIGQTTAGHVVDGQLRQPPALERGHPLRGFTEFMALPRLHFDKNDRLAPTPDDVNFSTPPAGAAGKKCGPAPLQPPPGP